MEGFTNDFMTDEIPSELRELHDFEKEIKLEYSQGFELTDLSEKNMLKSYSQDANFLAGLIEFAQANYSDSHYAFWTSNESNLSKSPIVIFGDEGGYHIVAENIKDLLTILSYDIEPMVSWDKVYYYKDESYEASPGKGEFIDWLFKKFKIEPTNEADSIVENAQKKYGQAFKDWMALYVQ
jgi:type II restriction/modification system DNA methylase subunit YeeA